MVSRFEKIELFPQALKYVISVMPADKLIVLICTIVFFICMILDILILPIIFNVYIIPTIEKKVGRKLSQNQLNNLLIFGGFLTQKIDVSIYIIKRYFALKFNKEHGLPKDGKRYALKQVGYTIDMASKAEIFLSFLVMINLYIGAIALVLGLVAINFPSIF